MTTDVERLFRQFTVSEVKEVERKIRSDVEKKKEDLRQMVGRRYQDIIEASDSINVMKQYSQKLLESIHNVQSSLSQIDSLNSQLNSCFKTKTYSSYESPVASKRALCKFLSDVPSLIWKSMDDDECLEAAWLYNLGDYVYRLVKTHTFGGKERAFVENSWKLVSTQLEPICTHSFNVLQKSENEDYECVLNSLCAIILTKSTKVDQILPCFLDNRTKLLISVLDNSELSSRAQICTALRTVQNTVLFVDRLFRERNSDTLRSKVQELNTTPYSSPRLLEYFELQSSMLVKRISKEMSDFAFHMEYVTPSEESVKTVCQQWITKVSSICNRKVNESLVYFASLEALCTLKSSVLEAIFKADVESDWFSSSTQWDTIFSNTIEKRLKELVLEKVSENFELMKLQIDECIQSYLITRGVQDFSFEQEDETLEISNQNGMQCRDPCLYLKSLGVPVRLYNVISEFDATLNSIGAQIDEFFSSDTKDQCSVTQQLLDESKTVLTDISVFIDHLLTRYLDTVETQSAPEKTSIYYARVCICFKDLCPALNNFLGKNDACSSAFANSMKSKALSLSNLYFRDILDEQCYKYIPLDFTVDENFWILNIQEWETVETSEQMDDGRILKSSLHVPLSLSPQIRNLLSGLSHKLCQVGAHVLPRETILMGNSELYARICRFYERFLSLPVDEALRHRQLLQIIFDLKFVYLFLHYEKGQSFSVHVEADAEDLIGQFESQVDPFEMDAVKTHLMRNVIRLAQKCQLTYGILLTETTSSALQRHFASLKTDSQFNNAVSTSTVLENHQIFVFGGQFCETSQDIGAGRSTRFQLLPVFDDTSAIGDNRIKTNDRKLKNDVEGGHSSAGQSSQRIGDNKLLPVASFSTLYGKFSSSLFGN